MARYEPPHYADWTPEKLRKEIKKLRETRRPLQRQFTQVSDQIKANDAAIQGMQFMLVCNSDLRDALRGWKPE